jgi:nitrite reductase/ring-hydroxylating ferredoxin subunit
VHASLVLLWYHGFAEMNAFVSLLVSNPRYDSIAGFPFESLGVAALIILFLMAATSHDFWNTNLGPGLWKALHMGVYAAYALLVAHVALGAIQFEKDPLYFILLLAGAGGLSALHLVTGLAALAPGAFPDSEGWLRVANVADFEDGRAKIVRPSHSEAIAVFRFGDSIAAVSNVCRHQGGPLGEGRIIDGCVTCPWHGFQYRPEDGCSPAPFTEMIATYKTKIEGGEVYVHAKANPLGRGETPSRIKASAL